MNGITHFLAGIIISHLVWHWLSDDWAKKRDWARREAFSVSQYPITVNSLLRVSFTSILAFFSHVIIDSFGRFTYHPYDYSNNILFYIIWMPIILVAGGIVLIIALRRDIRYIYGIVFALFFDLWDYSTLPLISQMIGFQNYGPLLLHNLEWQFSGIVFNWAPLWVNNPPAVIIELILLSILVWIWFQLIKKWPFPENTRMTPKLYQVGLISLIIILWIGISLLF